MFVKLSLAILDFLEVEGIIEGKTSQERIISTACRKYFALVKAV